MKYEKKYNKGKKKTNPKSFLQNLQNTMNQNPKEKKKIFQYAI